MRANPKITREKEAKMTLYLDSPSLTDQTKERKRKNQRKLHNPRGKLGFFSPAMATAHLELLHPSNLNLS